MRMAELFTTDRKTGSIYHLLLTRYSDTTLRVFRIN